MQTFDKLLVAFLLAVLAFSVHKMWELVRERYSDDECTLYLHLSTIDGAGRGVFAGRDYNINDMFPPVPVVYMAMKHIQ